MMYIELSENELLKVRIALMEKGNNWLDKSVESLKSRTAQSGSIPSRQGNEI